MSRAVAVISGIALCAWSGAVGCGTPRPLGSTIVTPQQSSKTYSTNNNSASLYNSSEPTNANPHSNATASLHISGNKMSIGNNVTVLSTKNGGQGWKVVTTVPNTALLKFGHSGLAWYAIETRGQNPKVRLHVTKDWGKHWTVSNQLKLPAARSARLQLLFAPGQKNGWLAVTAGAMNSSHTLQLWKSPDGGAHWSLISKVNPSDFLLGFQSSTDGWAEWSHAGSPTAAEFASPGSLKNLTMNLSKLDSSPALYRTMDGGSMWSPQFLPVPKQLMQHAGLASIGNMKWFGRDGFMVVTFSSDQLPYQKWGLYSTTDGGHQWSLHLVNGVSNNYGVEQHRVTFDLVDPSDLWETVTKLSQSSSHGPYKARFTTLYHSIGVEHRWSLVGKTPVPFENVQFVSRNIGFALSSKNGKLYRTTDGGHSWSLVH